MKHERQNMVLALSVVVGLLSYVAWLTDAPFGDNVKLVLLFAGSCVGLVICAWIARREARNPASLARRRPTPQRTRQAQWLLAAWQVGMLMGLGGLEWLLHQWGMNARSVEQVLLVSFGALQMVGLLGIWYWVRTVDSKG